MTRNIILLQDLRSLYVVQNILNQSRFTCKISFCKRSSTCFEWKC